jgi:hypothetical protein
MSFKSLIARLLQLARDQVFKLDDLAVRYGVQLADGLLDTFENKIENKIGAPIPIDFSIEQLFEDKLVVLSNKAQNKIAQRVSAKAQEIGERRAERLAEERSRSARHEAELVRIKEEYRNTLDGIDELASRITFSTVIKFFPPDEIVEVPLPNLGQVKEIERKIDPYEKEFRGDLLNELQNGIYSTISGQGATAGDITLLVNSRYKVENVPDIQFLYAENRITIKVKTNKRDKEPEIDAETEKKLRKAARDAYQDALEQERILWDDEKKQFREEDGKRVKLTPEERKARREQREKDRKARRAQNKADRQARRDKREEEKLTPQEREQLRKARRAQRKEDRDQRKDDRKQERDDNKERRKEARQLRKDNNKEERQRKRDERAERRADEEKRIDAAKDIRDLEEAEFDREIDEVEQILDQQVEAGLLTQREANQLLREVKSEQKVEVKEARQGIREVKQQIRQENQNRRAENRNDRAGREKGGKYDTSKLRDPEFVRAVYQQTYQFLPEQNKRDLANALGEIEQQLQTTVTVISSINATVIATRSILNTLNRTSTTIGGVARSIQIATDLITSLPIPTSTPPGVGLPVSIITTLCKTLDDLAPLVEKTRDSSDVISTQSENIQDKLENIVDILEPIIDVITIIQDIFIFLLYIARSGGTSLADIQNEISFANQEALSQSGDSSDKSANLANEDNLLLRLDPNSDDPLFYKGFRLTLQYVGGQGELTQTRVLGVNETNGVSLATDLSYTNSPQVLVLEMQFQIDNYNLIFTNNPNISIEDQLDISDPSIEGFQTIIPSTDIEDIEVDLPGLPPRFTKKQINQLRRKDKREDKKERRQLRKAGDLTRREAREDRKQDRRERKQQAKDRRRNRIRKKDR